MLTTIFLLILGAVIGFLIGKFFIKEGVNWQSQYNEADKERNNLQKLQKKEKKKQLQLIQQKTAMEVKLKASEEKYIPLTKDLNSQITQTKKELYAKIDSYDKLMTDQNRTTLQLEQLKEKYQKLKDTYATDMKDSKGWKNRREQYEEEITNWKKQFVGQKKKNQTLKATLDAQETKMAEVAKFTQEFKNMRASNRKLTKDLKYWEQKHFDTHHELAKTKVDIEALHEGNKEKELLSKGTEIQKENMMKEVEKFKRKFVDINNLYHKLKESQKEGQVG